MTEIPGKEVTLVMIMVFFPCLFGMRNYLK